MYRLQLLDYGRFIAILAVMAFHYLFNGIQNGKITSISYIDGVIEVAKYGYLGVEFFFMISGYVIFFSAKGKTPGEFAVSRAVRLYPAFWIAVVVTSIAAQFWGDPRMSVSFMQAVANLTMLPSIFGQGFVDGAYWTLELELYFYIMVMFFLFFGFQKKLELIFLIWPLVMLAAKIASFSHLPFAGGYYSYFSVGAIFAILKTRQDKLAICSLLISLALCISFSAGNAPVLSATKGVSFSAIIISAIVIAQLCFFIGLNSPKGSQISLPGSKLAGALTYPVYLIHAHLGYMLLSTFANNEIRIQAYCATVVSIFLIAFMIHKIGEKRYSTFWQRLFYRTIGAPINAFAARLRRPISARQR